MYRHERLWRLYCTGIATWIICWTSRISWPPLLLTWTVWIKVCLENLNMKDWELHVMGTLLSRTGYVNCLLFNDMYVDCFKNERKQIWIVSIPVELVMSFCICSLSRYIHIPFIDLHENLASCIAELKRYKNSKKWWIPKNKILKVLLLLIIY